MNNYELDNTKKEAKTECEILHSVQKKSTEEWFENTENLIQKTKQKKFKKM